MNTQSPRDGARPDIAAHITAKILADLEQGVLPWRKPWDGARAGLALPRRFNGNPYRGVNVVMLWSAAMANGYRSPFWLTLNQANQFGASIRKGERGELVVYYGQASKERKNDKGDSVEDSFRFLKCYTAFNAEQTEGLTERFFPQMVEQEIMALSAHEAWFAGLDIQRTLTHDTACYIPSKDVIGMPPVAAFNSPEAYAATLNHEAVHATGATHRVGRDMSKRFNAHALAAEELVAEIGASILGAHLALPPEHIHDHASYIGHWMELLMYDKRAFLAAAAQAQNAVDWLLAKSPAPTVDDCAGSAAAAEALG